MKKILLTALLAVVCMAASAKKEYFSWSAQQKLNGSITVVLDTGSSKWAQSLKGADGKAIQFNSNMDAMNYFAEQGWELCEMFIISTTANNVWHYIMEREVVEEQKTEE